MKVILTNNTEDDFPGYTKKPFMLIDDLFAGECQEVYVDGLINSFTIDQLEPALHKILSKIAYLGRVIITGIDVPLLVKQTLYEEQPDHNSFAAVNACISWKNIRDVALQRNFSLARCELNGNQFIVELVRNNE